MNTKQLGDIGEAAASAYLRARRYVIRERQYRCPMGEIDLIAERDGVLVFIEVKTRRNCKYGTPATAVNYRKQQKIIRTAVWYLEEHPPEDRPCRFDVMEVYGQPGSEYQIRHYENAFEV